METLEELQKILDGAPEDGDATHFYFIFPDEPCFDSIVYLDLDNMLVCNGGWEEWLGDIYAQTRSLADIQRIVDLMKLTRRFSKSLEKIATHIQKSQPSFCMGGVDSDDEFSSASKIIEYIESLEGK